MNEDKDQNQNQIESAPSPREIPGLSIKAVEPKTLLSKTPNEEGWYTGKLPDFEQEIAIRETGIAGDMHWQARIANNIRPHKYLNREAAVQACVAELQRLKIAG